MKTYSTICAALKTHVLAPRPTHRRPQATTPAATLTPTVPRPWLPYVLPFALYLAFLAVQTPERLPWLYPLKTVVVAAALAVFWRRYEELKPGLSGLGILVGVVAIATWIAIDPFYPGLSHLLGGKMPTPFDPSQITGEASRWTFLGFRLLGAVIVVPLMEELFWRGFLTRWLVKEDFKSVPIGAFTPFSFGATVVLFGVEHEQWLAGMICGALYNGLLYRTKSLFACVLAHATSNALLAAWVLARSDWKFW